MEFSTIATALLSHASATLNSHRANSAERWPELQWSVQSHQTSTIASCVLCGFLPHSLVDIDEVTLSVTAQARPGAVEVVVDVCAGPRVLWETAPFLPDTKQQAWEFVRSSIADAAAHIDVAVDELRSAQHPKQD